MTTAIRLTDKQALVLRAFAASDYFDGPNSTPYVPDVHEKSGMGDHAFAAVYGSLVSKGVIVTVRSDPKNPFNWFTGLRADGGATLYPDTCELTPVGRELLQSLLNPAA